MAEEGVAAGWVELAENIVEEVDRGFAATGVEEIALGELEGEGDGALLALAGVIGCDHAVETDGEIIAVGADDSLTGGGFALAGIASPILIAALVTAQGYAMLNLIAAAGFIVSAGMILSMPRTKAA